MNNPSCVFGCKHGCDTGCPNWTVKPEMPEGIWMIRYYTYDGCSRHDQHDVQFTWEYETAKGKLNAWQDGHLSDYEWEFDGVDDHKLVRREGQYGYSYYYIQFMVPGEDID